MSEDRRMKVLAAIVQDFVASSEPVGSRALVERYALGVSPATVRNDMAYLEDSGYIMQPHTSAGRVPTDKGYRQFVDQIDSLRPLSKAERGAIRTFLGEAQSLDDVLERTARMLANATRQVAIIRYPSLNVATLHHLELVRLSDHHVLVVIITHSGRVEQCTVEVTEVLPDLENLRAVLNEHLQGRRLTDLGDALDALAQEVADSDLQLVEAIVTHLVQTLRAESEERILLAGTANLARSQSDFPSTIGPVLDALEEHVVLLRLLSELAAEGQLAVSIGQENQTYGLAETSLVSTTYGTSDGSDTGTMAVLGPTRMDYPGTMAHMRAVARYVTQILSTR